MTTETLTPDQHNTLLRSLNQTLAELVNEVTRHRAQAQTHRDTAAENDAIADRVEAAAAAYAVTIRTMGGVVNVALPQ